MGAFFSRARGLPCVLVLGLLGCGGGTETVRVDIRTDWVPTIEFREIEVTLDDTGNTVVYTATSGDDFLAGHRVASIDGVAAGAHTVRARLLAGDGRRLAERRVAIEVRGPTTVTMVFTRDCATVTCPGSGDASATECVGGECVDPECSPENPDACGESQCAADSDCPDPTAACARSVCLAGTCFTGSDFSICATSEYCNPESGCSPRPTGSDMGPAPLDGGPADMGDGADMGADAGPGDMGPGDMGPAECGQPCDTGDLCEIGIYDCASGAPICVRDRLVAAGVRCRPAAGACDVEETCDGTRPSCPFDAFQPTGTSCAEGFCDGLGACSDSCTPGASCSTGNPCEVGTVSCDSGAPVCQRAANAPDGIMCAATQNGSWGSCGGFSGTCDETGTRSRTVTDYRCQSGSCASNPSSQTESCGRSTGGTSCGSVAYGSWGACGGFANTCDQTGTRSRTVNTPTCSGASCGNVASTQTEACSRSTSGDSCGSVTYGSWSACGGFANTCDQTGTRSRTVNTPTCSGASCGNVASTQTEACSRSTSGDSCGSVTYGSWSACGGFANTCDETGTRSRTVNTPTCSGASCGNVASTQTEACSRSTGGNSCGTVTYGGWGACGGYADACDQTGTRSRSSTIPTCSSGSCVNVGGTDTGSCSRSTDGISCGAVTYGSWGACGGFSSFCDETGTQSRTVTTPTCSAGSCAGVGGSESQSCARDTDGQQCGVPPFSCQVRSCVSGSCNSYDTCGPNQHCCEFGCRPTGTFCD